MSWACSLSLVTVPDSCSGILPRTYFMEPPLEEITCLKGYCLCPTSPIPCVCLWTAHSSTIHPNPAGTAGRATPTFTVHFSTVKFLSKAVRWLQAVGYNYVISLILMLSIGGNTSVSTKPAYTMLYCLSAMESRTHESDSGLDNDILKLGQKLSFPHDKYLIFT